MTSRVLKWIIPIDDQVHIIGPGPVVLVGNNTGDPGFVCVWTQEYSGPKSPDRMVQVFGTGQTIPTFGEVVGSTVQGNFVWHVIEIQQPSAIF